MTLRQMLFEAPDGRREALWVEHLRGSLYRVLNPPVWYYGVSVGSTVEAGPESPGELLALARVVSPSEGGTVRCVVPQGAKASEVYKARVLEEARSLGIGLGPATFYDPRLVSIHVRSRGDCWPAFGGLLERLRKEGIVMEWEFADPERDASPESQERVEDRAILFHQLPVEGSPSRDVS